MSRLLSVLPLAIAALFVGCGSPYSLHPVTGKVTLDGAPLVNASVTFHPAGTEGQPASGVTDANGAYRIRDVRPDADFGAEVGEYTVTIYWAPPPAVDTSKMDSSSPEYEKMAASLGSQANAKVEKNPFPQAYQNPSSSGLKATVQSGANENLDFALSAKGPGK